MGYDLMTNDIMVIIVSPNVLSINGYAIKYII
jgi:hypothetical protein